MRDDAGYIHQYCEAALRQQETELDNHVSSRPGRAAGCASISAPPSSSGRNEFPYPATGGGDSHHFDLVVAAGAKEKLTLMYREADEVVTYTLRVGGKTVGMDIGFQVTYQPHGADVHEEVDAWSRHGMGADKINVSRRCGSDTACCRGHG